MYPYFEKNSRNIFISHEKRTYNFPSHFHNGLEITFCLSGMQNIKVGEKISH